MEPEGVVTSKNKTIARNTLGREAFMNNAPANFGVKEYQYVPLPTLPRTNIASG